MRVLVGDIGGTHSRFAAFDEDPLRLSLRAATSSGAADFAAVLTKLQRKNAELFTSHPDVCVLAVAGPVVSQVEVQPTNLPYVIQKDACGQLGKQIFFINDFEAQARACLTSLMENAVLLWAGKDGKSVSPRVAQVGHYAVIGAGTGLGAAVLEKSSARNVRAFPSEGGHASFPVHTCEELALADFICERKKTPYLRGDDILCGSGLAYLHLFLTGEQKDPQEITSAANFPGSETCAWFARLYGRFCRNFALTTMTAGGIVITGGVATAAPGLVRHPEFSRALLDCPGRHGAWLANLPVWHLANKDSGLWGAAQAALSLKV